MQIQRVSHTYWKERNNFQLFYISPVCQAFPELLSWKDCRGDTAKPIFLLACEWQPQELKPLTYCSLTDMFRVWALKLSLNIYQGNLLIFLSLCILPFTLFTVSCLSKSFLDMTHKTPPLTSYLFPPYNLTQFLFLCFSLPWKPFPWCTIRAWFFLKFPHLLLSTNPRVTFTAIFFSLSSRTYLTAFSTPSHVDATFRFVPSSFSTAHYPWSSAELQFYLSFL